MTRTAFTLRAPARIPSPLPIAAGTRTRRAAAPAAPRGATVVIDHSHHGWLDRLRRCARRRLTRNGLAGAYALLAHATAGDVRPTAGTGPHGGAGRDRAPHAEARE